MQMSKFRCGNSNIPVHTSRFNNIAHDERLCNLCDMGKLGDEFHFLFECSSFANERQMYIPRFFRIRPSVFKMSELFSKTSHKTQYNLSLFCKIIMVKFKWEKNITDINGTMFVYSSCVILEEVKKSHS